MMDQLIRLADRLREGLQDRLALEIKSDAVQGALLEIDRYWYMWILSQYAVFHPFAWGQRWQSILYHPFDWDFNALPHDWDRHCVAMGYAEGASPIVIRVILRYPPDRSHGQGDREMRDLPVNYEGHPVLYEHRPTVVATAGPAKRTAGPAKRTAGPAKRTAGPAKRTAGPAEQPDRPRGALDEYRYLAAATNAVPELIARLSEAVGWPRRREESATSVGQLLPTSTAGTLGGYLRCPVTNRHYLVSCAHVLGSVGRTTYTPGPFDNREASPVGKVRFSEITRLKASGEFCNPRAMPNAGRLDLAVAELDPTAGGQGALSPQVTVHALRRSEHMESYQPVTFVGKESGRVEAQLCGVSIWHVIDFEDFGEGPRGPRCFGTLFVMNDRSGAGRIVAQGGDSGAWVFDEAGGMRCWNGMLIARQGDGKTAYGCFAEFILDALSNSQEFPKGLTMAW